MSEAERLRRTARAITDKVADELPVGQLIPGTVKEYGMGVGTAGPVAVVHVDGDDPPDHTIEVPVLTPVPLAEGTRVLVLFDPPEGSYVYGSLSAPSVNSERSTMRCGGGSS